MIITKKEMDIAHWFATHKTFSKLNDEKQGDFAWDLIWWVEDNLLKNGEYGIVIPLYFNTGWNIWIGDIETRAGKVVCSIGLFHEILAVVRTETKEICLDVKNMDEIKIIKSGDRDGLWATIPPKKWGKDCIDYDKIKEIT